MTTSPFLSVSAIYSWIIGPLRRAHRTVDLAIGQLAIRIGQWGQGSVLRHDPPAEGDAFPRVIAQQRDLNAASEDSLSSLGHSTEASPPANGLQSHSAEQNLRGNYGSTGDSTVANRSADETIGLHLPKDSSNGS